MLFNRFEKVLFNVSWQSVVTMLHYSAVQIEDLHNLQLRRKTHVTMQSLTNVKLVH